MGDRKIFDRTFYRQLLSLVLPIAFQQFMLSAVSASDAVMLGSPIFTLAAALAPSALMGLLHRKLCWLPMVQST